MVICNAVQTMLRKEMELSFSLGLQVDSGLVAHRQASWGDCGIWILGKVKKTFPLQPDGTSALVFLWCQPAVVTARCRQKKGLIAPPTFLDRLDSQD